MLLTLNEAEKNCLSNPKLSKVDVVILFRNAAQGKDAEKE